MIGIIGAMEVEVDLLIQHMEDTECKYVGGWSVYHGQLKGQEVCVARSGIGKVHAALCAQVLIDLFQPEALINTGIAGSLNPDIEIGDFVIAQDCIQHDMDVTALGFARGEVPGINKQKFIADSRLTDELATAAQNLDEHAVWQGTIASGDQFIAREEDRQAIVQTFGALCCEMEGAAIAQACWCNAVPFAIIRVISDKPGSEEQVQNYSAFEKESAYRCAMMVENFLAAHKS